MTSSNSARPDVCLKLLIGLEIWFDGITPNLLNIFNVGYIPKGCDDYTCHSELLHFGPFSGFIQISKVLIFDVLQNVRHRTKTKNPVRAIF
jgi:hypothetical protein